MIGAKDIRNKKFDKVAFGYKAEDVDEFMQQLEADLREMEHSREDANSKIQILADKVREYRADEDALKDALLGAQKQGRQVLTDANEKAEEILREAKDKADALLDEAVRQHAEAMESNRKEIDRERQNLILAQNQVAEFKKSLFDMYKNHLELISQMPDSEVDLSEYEEEEAPVEEAPAPDYEEAPEEENAYEETYTEERDPFATSQFSAKTIRGEYDARFSDLKFGQNNTNTKDE